MGAFYVDVCLYCKRPIPVRTLVDVYLRKHRLYKALHFLGGKGYRVVHEKCTREKP